MQKNDSIIVLSRVMVRIERSRTCGKTPLQRVGLILINNFYQFAIAKDLPFDKLQASMVRVF